MSHRTATRLLFVTLRIRRRNPKCLCRTALPQRVSTPEGVVVSATCLNVPRLLLRTPRRECHCIYTPREMMIERQFSVTSPSTLQLSIRSPFSPPTCITRVNCTLPPSSLPRELRDSTTKGKQQAATPAHLCRSSLGFCLCACPCLLISYIPGCVTLTAAQNIWVVVMCLNRVNRSIGIAIPTVRASVRRCDVAHGSTAGRG